MIQDPDEATLPFEERLRREAVRNGLERHPRLRRVPVLDAHGLEIGTELLAFWMRRNDNRSTPLGAGQGPSADHAIEACYRSLASRFKFL